MKREITRTKGDQFCTARIEIENGRLSVCGTAGRIVTRAAAKKEALQSWVDYFEDSPAERHAMNKKCNRTFKTAKSAARFVIVTDGEFHGLDVHGTSDEKTVRIVQSCGQIKEELVEFFPEIAPLLPWHLNDLKAGCEHQDVLGWGHGIDVTVEPESKEAQNAWGATVTVTTQRKVYKDSIGAPCPTCGYCYGTAWTKRELPPEIVKLAEEVAA